MKNHLHSIKLKPSTGLSGCPVAGLWVSDIVQLEKVAGGWECRVSLKRIGNSNYFEFCPVLKGGEFLIAGTYRTKDDCCLIAERLKSGTHVLREQIHSSSGVTPVIVIAWSKVSNLI